MFDTPLSEDAMTGVAIGMALAGLRPIHVHIRMDFLLLAMNQLVNVAAKSRYMYGGQVCVPLVVRAMIGKSWGQGAQHSQGLHSCLCTCRASRSSRRRRRTTPRAARSPRIRDDNPVMFVEHRLLHSQTGHVPEELYTVPLGQVPRAGRRRATSRSSASRTQPSSACGRGDTWQTVGIAAEVIDPIWLSPLDVDTIAASVRRTGRLLVVDTAWTNCGASAEIVAAVAERLGRRRSASAAWASPRRPARRAAAGGPVLPQRADDRRGRARPGRGRRQAVAAASSVDAPEILEFKGPF